MALLIDKVDWTALARTVRAQQKSREKQTPVVSLYRWWARRSHALIGALLDAAAQQADGRRLVVSDPLSGGGTVAIEAARRGYRIYAQDLHPWATFGLATALDGVDPDELERATAQLLAGVAEFRSYAYGAECQEHGPSETVHAFWVRECHCLGCSRPFFLFPYSLITVLSRSKSEPHGYFGCPACGSANRLAVDSNSGRCGICQRLLPYADKPLLGDRQTTCPHCGRHDPIAKSIMEGWKLILVQRLCEHNGSATLHFDVPGPRDVSVTTSVASKAACLNEDIPEGLETRVLRQVGFHRWSDLYPARQLECLVELARAARSLDTSVVIRQRLILAIVGATEMAGHLCRWDRYYPKAFEAMANHRFSPVGLGVEVNLLSPRGRGTLPRRLAASVKAAKWARQQFGEEITPAVLVQSERRRWSSVPSRPLVVTGSSERQLLPAKSVDIALTDPPYFDSVQYGELSSLFHVWARATGLAVADVSVNLNSEAVPNRVRGTAYKDYKSLLERIFAEIGRCLNQGGRVLLTFHSTDIRAWHALGSALSSAELSITGLAVCHAENEADHAKRGKRAFTKDLIIECERETNQRSPVVVTPPKDDEETELVSAGLSMAACGEKEISEMRSDYLSRLAPGFERRIR